jgi:osmotically-inducible protein OsmY
MSPCRALDLLIGPILAVVVITGSAVGLGGCASAVVGTGAAVGVAAFEERSVVTVARDAVIASKIRLGLFNAGEKYITRISIEVYEGRVLITGATPDESMHAEAVHLAWKIEGVTDVINEIQISDTGFVNTIHDSLITARLTSSLTFDQEILAINYSVETVNGIVYLIGVAQSSTELKRVIAHAHQISYVRKVISHVRVKKTGT